MPPDYSQNAAHREAGAADVANHFTAANGLHEEIAAMADNLDAIRPPGFGRSSEDLYKEAINLFAAQNPEYAKSLASISRAAPKHVEVIFAKWDRLRAIVGQHMGTIKHRWEKRTVEKRKLILNEARGKDGLKIPSRRRPNFDAYKRGLRGDEYKWLYLLPSINLEDLSDKANLMIFIESRSTKEPYVFAWMDTSTVHMASENGVTVRETYGHNMLLTGESRETYGSIVSWGNDVHSMIKNWTNMYEGRGFHLGQGFTCLEIQNRILSFLVDVSELLLADVDLSNVMDLVTGSVPGTTFTTTDSVQRSTEYSTLMEVHSKARYQVPQQFDLLYLRQLAISKKDEAWENMWGLREEPSLFQEWITDSYNYHRECDIASYSDLQPGRNRSTIRDRMAFRIACRDVVEKACSAAIAWHMILEDLELVEALQHKYGSDISATKPSPEAYNDALHVLSLSVREWMKLTLRDLALRTASYPALRQYYRFQTGDQGLFAEPISSSVQPPQIVVLLNDLQDVQQRQVFGTSELLDDIEHMMRQSGNQRTHTEVIDISMARLLSEVAAYGEIESQTTQHQPKIRLPKDNDACTEKWEKRLDTRTTILKILAKDESMATFCEPLSEFSYPFDKKRTEQTVNQLRTAEAKLDAFWQHVDQHFVHHSGRNLQELLGKVMDDDREIQRTAPWQPPVVQPKEPKLPKSTIYDETLASQMQDMRLSQPAKETIIPLALKVKVKTRGEVEPSSEDRPDEHDNGAADDSTIPDRQFMLPKKAYAVMSALFPSHQDRLPGKIRWVDFMGAMSKLDFSIRPGWGSEHYFQPSWAPDSPITIHGPHPEAEITRHHARRYAGHLSRKYGWKSESFLLK